MPLRKNTFFLHKNHTVVSPAYCQMMMRGEDGGKLAKMDEERYRSAQQNLGVKVIVEPMPKMSESQLLKKALVAGAWTERKKMYHGGSFLKLGDFS